VTPRLAALVRRELVRPDQPQLPREDAYRFRHLLIRDAAYGALPKATRADLHRRFAAWLEQHGQDLVELEEILGYHLERAARYLDELGRSNSELALAAGERLGLAGRRAFWRGDPRAAAGLLERALTLTRPHRLDVHLEAELATAHGEFDLSRALEVADAAALRADADGDEVAVALMHTVASRLRVDSADLSSDALERVARAALLLLEEQGDDDGLVHVWRALALVANVHSRSEGWAQAIEQTVVHARRAGHAVVGSFFLGVPLVIGPTPASEALARLDQFITDQPHPGDLLMRGVLLAMLDRIDEAWAVAAPALERMREMGFRAGPIWLAEIAMISGDRDAATLHLRSACENFEAGGRTAELSTYAPQLGRVLCARGLYDEAEVLAERGRALGTSEDVWTQALWRQAKALVHSAHAQHAEAVQLAREAVDWFARTDCLPREADAYCDLAEVLEAAGRREEAVAAWHKALDRYERKGIIPLARRVRERLAVLQSA
jgi:tetratricopeptide (TPR) repeat protein